MKTLRLKYTGGPNDGGWVELDSRDLINGKCIQVLIEGRDLYSSNRPYDGIETECALHFSYCSPLWNDPNVQVLQDGPYKRLEDDK